MPQRAEETRMALWVARVERWPRLGRIVLSFTIALIMSGLVWWAVAKAFGIRPLDEHPDATLALVIVVVAGFAFYGYGWWVLVGFDSPSAQTWQARPRSVWWALLGGIALVLAVLLVLFGLLYGYVL